MLRPTISCAVCLLLVAAVARMTAAGRAATPAAAARSSILFGDGRVEPTVGKTAPGREEAFPVADRLGGTISSISVYVSARNRADKLLVGLYSSSGGHPGSLITAGSRSSLKAGSWNTVVVAPIALRAKRTYWVAVLGRGGTLYFRDRRRGRCHGEDSRRGRLTTLPHSWMRGSRRDSCPISAYGIGRASGGQGPVTGAGPGASPVHAAAAPVNATPPLITGAAQVGSTLSASSGTWAGRPTAYSYEWQDCDPTGASCTTVPGATGPTYTIIAGDVGSAIRVVVTASNAGGSTPQASSATSAVAPVPSWYVAPNGSDANPCTQSQPCLTFNHVYHRASPGQLVAVADGTYPTQSLSTNPAFANGPALVFRGSASSNVTIDGQLRFDGNTHWVEFDNMTVDAGSDTAGLYMNAQSDTVRDSNITFRNLVDIGGLDINSDDDISWIGGSMGPVLNWDPEIKEGYKLTHQPTNILIDGVTFHDCRRNDGVSHVECLHVMNVNGLTIRNSTFYNSEAFDLEFTQYGVGESSNVTLENNWFGAENGYYAVYIGNLNGGIARFNSSLAGWYVEFTNDTSTGGDVRDFTMDSNVFPSVNSALCTQAGTTWSYNVVGSGSACAHGRTGPIDYTSNPGVTSSPIAAGVPPDYDLLPGSVARGAGNPTSFPATNIHGAVRASPPNAGAS